MKRLVLIAINAFLLGCLGCSVDQDLSKDTHMHYGEQTTVVMPPASSSDAETRSLYPSRSDVPAAAAPPQTDGYYYASVKCDNCGHRWQQPVPRGDMLVYWWRPNGIAICTEIPGSGCGGTVRQRNGSLIPCPNCQNTAGVKKDTS